MDYFSILGVERTATADELKTAFRRLALEFHPDRVGHLEADKQAEAARRMSEVNEAYTVLSDPDERKEYEAELDAPPAPAQPTPPPAPAATAPPPTVQRKTAPQSQPNANLARDFSQQVKKDLATAAGLKFEAQQVEGFDWGLSARTWTSQYLIASRAFQNADAAAAQKYLRNAEQAVTARGLRKQNTLLLLPFGKIYDSAKVAGMFRDFCNQQGGTTLVVLLDMTRSEKLICGPKPKDAKLQELATGLKLPK